MERKRETGRERGGEREREGERWRDRGGERERDRQTADRQQTDRQTEGGRVRDRIDLLTRLYKI